MLQPLRPPPPLASLPVAGVPWREGADGSRRQIGRGGDEPQPRPGRRSPIPRRPQFAAAGSPDPPESLLVGPSLRDLGLFSWCVGEALGAWMDLGVFLIVASLRCDPARRVFDEMPVVSR